MILTTYTIGTPAGVFQANWDEDEDERVSYTGEPDAIAFFRSYLDLAAPDASGGKVVTFEALEPDDLVFIAVESAPFVLIDPLEQFEEPDDSEPGDQQEPEMKPIYDSASDADTFTLIGEGAQLLAALDENSDTFFADLGRLREIVLALGRDAAPAARTLNVDSIKAFVAESVPANLPAGWIIMNAPRPLLGQETAQGDFLTGRYYAAIDPEDEFAQGYIDRNVQDGAVVVFVADTATQTAMALNLADPDYLPAYLEMDAQELSESIGGLTSQLHEGMTYGELKALAAKGMPTVAAPAVADPVPVPDPAPEPTPEPAQPTSPADMENYIKVAADSIGALRRVDVYRVLNSLAADNIDGVTRAALAQWIIEKRDDLAPEVRTVMAEEWPGEFEPVDVVPVDPVVGVNEPLPDGGAVVPAADGETPDADPERAPDLAFLNDVSAGNIDMWEHDPSERIEAIVAKYGHDEGMVAAARAAVNAYVDLMAKAIAGA